jgi:hypothetical protein
MSRCPASRRGTVLTTTASATRTGSPQRSRRAAWRLLRRRNQRQHDHAFMAVALNLLRLNAYWNGQPLDRSRTSHLARLELSLAA